jgi:hypothetical protein
MVQRFNHQMFCEVTWVRILLQDNVAKKCFPSSPSMHPGSNPRRSLQVTSCLGQTWTVLEQVSCILKLYKACLCISINIKTRVERLETPRQLDKLWGSLDRLCQIAAFEK